MSADVMAAATQLAKTKAKKLLHKTTNIAAANVRLRGKRIIDIAIAAEELIDAANGAVVSTDVLATSGVGAGGGLCGGDGL